MDKVKVKRRLERTIKFLNNCFKYGTFGTIIFLFAISYFKLERLALGAIWFFEFVINHIFVVGIILLSLGIVPRATLIFLGLEDDKPWVIAVEKKMVEIVESIKESFRGMR